MRKISRTSLLMSQIIFPHLSKMKCLRNLSINAPDFTRDKFFQCISTTLSVSVTQQGSWITPIPTTKMSPSWVTM